MLGGIVADFARPPVVATLPAAVQEGIRLHRLIDGFTDRHPIVQGSISRIAEKFHWFSGIIIDIYYDHILARDWSRYSAEPLEAFADRAYDAIEAQLEFIPEEGREFARRFIDDDRLVQYGTIEGITNTLSRVS